jgi:RHS repeat-associated protein
MATTQWLHAHTPTLSVVDPRGWAVRNVAYCRHPLSPATQPRITRNHFDAAGRAMASWDPRLFGTAPKPNLVTLYDLQNQPLLVDSVDAGWQLSLLDQAGSVRSFWDGRGSQRHTEYDELRRPLTVTEQMQDDVTRVVECFAYGGAGEGFAAHNQCGQLIRHDHPAGTRSLCEYGVDGSVLVEQTRFLLALDLSDWPPDVADREHWLETEVFTTAQRYGACGEVRDQTDAMGNVRSFAHNIAGEVKETRLKLVDSSEEPRLLAGEIRYDAVGRVESERAGNSVITTARYSGEDGRLLQLLSRNAQGKPLQDLNYAYDPVGNITSIKDKAQLTRHSNGQRIDPVNRYGYDSLYQLIEARGREVSQPGYGPALPAWQTTPLDPNQLRNYTQTFNHDAAGNLQTRQHKGAETFEMFTSADSNRSVADRENLADGFDANGNQLELLRGQQMSWDLRNQLSRVTMVRREDGPDDSECYFYDSPGHRLRKVRLTEAASCTLRTEVRYLPGVEIHRDAATGEERHVLSVGAGFSHVRALHWVEKPPKGVRNDQLRFCLKDHLDSCMLELDEQGTLLSRETYYPFGGTALWAGTSETEAKYKTLRYSGKERDATGLYYYGYRYYAPWLQRWVSADPAGNIDDVNFFVFVANNPLVYVDLGGLVRQGINEFLTKNGSWEDLKVNAGRVAMERQESVYSAFDVKPSSMRRDYFRAYAYDSNRVVNDYLRYGREHGVLTERAFSLFFVAPTDIARISALTKIVSALPHTGVVPLYRGGSGGRGTSGEFFRQGSLGPGSVLINTDFTSFTENPYIAAEFAGLNESAIYFDETSVIFEIAEHFSPKPIAPDALRIADRINEAESVVMPAAAFEINSVGVVDVFVKNKVQSYVHVSMKEVEPPKVTPSSSGAESVLPNNVFDFRTGTSVNFEQLKSRLGNSAELLLQRYYS